MSIKNYLIAGKFLDFNGNTRNRIVLLNEDGTENVQFYNKLGTGFGDITNASQVPFASALQADGKILVGGGFTLLNGNTRNRLVRLNENGVEDITFYNNLGTAFDGPVLDIKVQPDGKIVVVGSFTSFNGNTRNRIVRLNSDGTEDTTFYTNTSGGFNNDIRAVDIAADGKIWVGGTFILSLSRFAVINTDGTGKTGVGPVNSTVDEITIQPDGKIIIGGSFTSPKTRIARFNSDGTQDTTFNTNIGSGFNSVVDKIIVQTDNKILIGGGFTTFNSNGRNRVVRLNSDGTEDTAFYTNLGTSFNQPVLSLILDDDGSIVVSGDFTQFNGNIRNCIVKLNSDGTENTAFYSNIGTGITTLLAEPWTSLLINTWPPAPCSSSLFEFSGSNITYNYGIGTKAIVTNIYDSGGYQIQPNSLTASLNKVDFDFTFPTEGWIVVQQADYSQSFSSTASVNVSHSLNTEDVIVNVFDTNDTLITPDLVTISGSNNVIVDFSGNTSGYVTVVDSISSQTFNNVTQSLFPHGLQTKNLLVSVYDTGGEQIVPDDIQILNDETASITFSSQTSGKIVIDRVCRIDNYIYIGTASISQSESVCVPITVGNDFNNIETFQGTINFDPDIITYVSSSNNNIGLTLFNPIPGNLTFSWISPYLTGSNFTSGSTLLELCFSGSESGSSNLQFTGFPTQLEITDINSNVLSVSYFSGSFEVAPLPLPPSTSVYIGTASVSQSNGVCVPITVGDGFENVLTWQGTIAYNEFVLDYVNTTNNNLGITLFNPTSGSLTFSWISPYITGSTFSSGSTLFEVCFTASEGGFSELEFTSSPTLLEMGDNSGSIFVVDYFTGSIFVTPTTSSNIDVTLYLYSTSSEAEFFDILYSSASDGPWIIAPSGSSIDLLNLYSYTVSIPTGSNYLKLVNKNPEYYPDNYKIHDINFGEPTKGVIPTGSVIPPNLIQSMSGEITIYNDGPSSIEVTNLYMSASIYMQSAFMPSSVTIGTGSSSVFIVDSLPTTGSPIVFPNQIELVVEISGNLVSELTGSWEDSGSNENIYPTAWVSGSYFSSPYTYNVTYFDTKPTFTSESQARIIGTLTV